MLAMHTSDPILQPAERLSERLANWLLQRIESGQWPAGHRLPPEQQISREHGVSRTVVREAVSRLKSMGWLRSRQGSGIYVCSQAAARPLAFDPTVLTSMSAVLQVVEVRRSLEGEVAALAAQRITPARQARIDKSLAAIDKAVDEGRDGVEEDLAFHRAIAQAAGNPQFERMLDFLDQYLRDAIRVTRANEAMQAQFMRQVRQEHQAIAQAVASGDASAARRAAVRHMVNAVKRIERADASVRDALGAVLRKAARKPGPGASGQPAPDRNPQT